MLYQRRDDYMNVHGKIAIAAIAAALSVGAGAVPAIAEEADAGAAKPVAIAQESVQSQPVAADVSGNDGADVAEPAAVPVADEEVQE